MNYRIKSEYLEFWGTGNIDLLTEEEAREICRGWDQHLEDVLPQLEPISMNIAQVLTDASWGRRYAVKTRSAMKAAHEYGTGMKGEQVTILDAKGREISKVVCGMRGYYRVTGFQMRA